MLPLLLALSPVAPGQASAAPVFLAASSDPTPARGRVEAVGEGWAVTLRPDGGEPVVVSKGALVSLRRADRALPPWPAGAVVVLANGDRIAGSVVGGNDKAVRVAPRVSAPGNASWSVPLTTLAAVWVTSPPPDAPADPSAYAWADSPGRRDAVLLRNGDVLRGTVEEFTDAPGFNLKTGTTVSPIPLAQVAAVAFDPALARVRKPKGPFARAVLADGSRLSLGSAKADGATLTATTLTGTPVQFPLAQLVALDVFQGKAAYLSDLKPAKADAQGFNGLAWPWAADRSAKGNPLRVGADTFDKGLGTHPKTTLTYPLGGKYRRFEAVVGLDPSTGRRGVADVRVLVDGKEVTPGGLKGLTAAAGPVNVIVDVAGAKDLTLVVEFGPGGDVQADVNWGNARLIE